MILKICMIGLGSIGKRHLRNLITILNRHNKKYQIDALRSNDKCLQEEWYKVITSQYFHVEDMPNDYDIIFITNPTFLHYDTIKKTIDKTKHMFIEKPVFESIDYNIDFLRLNTKGVYYVACPLRHKSIIKYVKHEIVPKEKIISVRIVSSSYLPSWRAGVDYRKVYSAKTDLGGGVTRDLIHEWDYAIYLFGKPKEVVHIKDHLSDLEIDSDDISVYIARYQNMILEMHLDYVGHKTERTLQMFTNNKRIDVDLISDTIYEYKNNKLLNNQTFLKEDYYMNELEYFFKCIEMKENNINTIENAYSTLKIALMEG